VVAIEMEGLEKAYQLGFFKTQTVRALRGLTLRVDPGQVYGLIGPNGAGKSTAIKILLNLVQPSAGKARIFGVESSKRESRKDLGFVPENPAPYEHLTGAEFVELAAKLGGLKSAEVRKRTSEALERVGMTRAAALRIRRYSKGMTQRIVLAGALVCQPKIMVLDEPTSGLDPVGRRLVRDIIFEERKKGTTMLFCTHIISDVEAVCDRLSVLLSGQCVREGTVAELLSGQSPKMEVTVEDIAAEQLGAVEVMSTVGTRSMVRLLESDLTPFMQSVLSKQGKVIRVVPSRYSLEDVFMEALQQSGGNTVGGLIE
jgi:ABC-2 type transport system ATP-binding protein